MTTSYSHKIFVYGSLLSNLGNHQVLLSLKPQVRLISDNCITTDKFYLTGLKSNEYPYLSAVPLRADQVASQIKGELYEVTAEALAELDDFEDHPIEYLRSLITVSDLSSATLEEPGNAKAASLEANVYMLRNQLRIEEARAAFDKKFVIVHDGDWKSHLKNIRQSF